MISIKDYSIEKKISTQAVYKQLKIHAKKLDGHIIKAGGKKMLDDYAVDYLSNLSENNPIVLSDRQMKQEIERLQAREIELLNELNQKNNIIIHLQQENRMLIEQKNEKKSLFSKIFKKQ